MNWKQSLLALPLLAALNSLADEPKAPTQGKAEHVVVVVWDGMRPDFVTGQNAPTLYKLSTQGVFFQNNHAAYVTSTEVNGTVIATGVYPNRSHLIANREYRPAIDPQKPFGTEQLDPIRKADAAGKYLGIATLEETLHANGIRTVIAGTKGVALLPDRSEQRDSDAAKHSVVIFDGKSIPATAVAEAAQAAGSAYPKDVTYPNSEEDTWTARALTEYLWKDGVPPLSVMWMSDPDYSQHYKGPGSPTALAAIKSADDRLASVLAALETKGVRDKTDIIIVSDHGFSTVEKNTNVIKDLTAAGFTATDKFDQPPKAGDIMVNVLGGTIFFYITGHDAATTQKLVDFLQGWENTGVILTREKMKGTFTLEQARINSPDAPDVAVSMKWTDHTNDYGTPGTILSELPRKPGQGMHGTLSKFDIHNTLIAAGPDFKPGMKDELPTGNVDVAPTIYWLLGVTPPEKLDGRVLTEAIAGATAPEFKPVDEILNEERNEGSVHWSQYLKITHFGPWYYLDEGGDGKR